MSEILVNTVIEWRDENIQITEVERVLWVSPDCSEVVVINIKDFSHLPQVKSYQEIQNALEHNLARKLKDDPYSAAMMPKDSVPKSGIEARDRAWEIIAEMVGDEPDIYDRAKRGQLIAEVCKKYGVHKKDVYRYLKRFWIRGKTKNALLKDYSHCGAPGKEKVPKNGVKLGRPRNVSREDPNLVGVNVDEFDKKNIKIAVKQWYLDNKNNQNKNPLTFAYQQMLECHYNTSVYFKNGVPVPILISNEKQITYIQFRYWALKAISETENALQKRFGTRAYNLTKRPLLGNATTRSFGPGAIYEIDATPTNVYFISQFDRRRIIGRSVLYKVKDVFSHLIVGLYVGLEGPNWIGAMMALENAFSDKVEFCAKYGIDIDESDWPCHYIPKCVYGDRGELLGFDSDSLNSLGVRVQNAQPWRPDMKGIVEQDFMMDQRRVEPFVPGLIQKELRERGEPDYRLNARLTIPAFTKIMILTILERNKKELGKDYPLDKDMTIEGVPRIPLEIWNWGIVNRSGHLSEKPKDVIRQNLLPHSKASVTRRGIYFEKAYYGCDKALDERWYERAINGRFSVPICYDPRNPEFIYILNSDGTDSIKCQRLPQYDRFRNYRLEEIQDQLFFEEVERKRREINERQMVAETSTQIKSIITEEKELTEKVWPKDASNASLKRNIRGNRKEDKEKMREQEAWELGMNPDGENRGGVVIAIESLLNNDDSETSKNNSVMAMLKMQRSERTKK